MTALKDLRRHPAHNVRNYKRPQKAATRLDDFGHHFAGGPFRQTVRAAIPDVPKLRSR